MMVDAFAGQTFVLRIDDSPAAERSTLQSDLAFLMARNIRPILVAPSPRAARSYVKVLNRGANVAVGLSGADAALLPAGSNDGVGRVQTGILLTLTAAGYIPVIEPTAFAFAGQDVALPADDVAAAVAAATDAARAMFFHASGGVFDPQSEGVIAELTPAEALALADRADIDGSLRATIRAAAHVVRAGVPAAQIVDGRVAHAAIVELLTARHLGTQVTGAVYMGVRS